MYNIVWESYKEIGILFFFLSSLMLTPKGQTQSPGCLLLTRGGMGGASCHLQGLFTLTGSVMGVGLSQYLQVGHLLKCVCA